MKPIDKNNISAKPVFDKLKELEKYKPPPNINEAIEILSKEIEKIIKK